MNEGPGKELINQIYKLGDRLNNDFTKISDEAMDRFINIMTEYYSLREKAAKLFNSVKIKPNDSILVDGETFLITNVERNGDVVTVTTEREEQGA